MLKPFKPRIKARIRLVRIQAKQKITAAQKKYIEKTPYLWAKPILRNWMKTRLKRIFFGKKAVLPSSRKLPVDARRKIDEFLRMETNGNVRPYYLKWCRLRYQYLEENGGSNNAHVHDEYWLLKTIMGFEKLGRIPEEQEHEPLWKIFGK